MGAREWYYVENGQSVGPVDHEELLRRIGRSGPDTLVYGPGLTAWTAAKHVAGLSSAGHGVTAPPPSPTVARRADDIDYRIQGEDLQFVEIELDPGETVVAEAGALMYMTAGIDMQTVLGDPSAGGQGLLGKVFSAGKRLMTGESMFMTTFVGRGPGKQQVAFAAPYPGRVVTMDLHQLGGELLCQKDSFLCGAKGVSVGIAFTKRFGAGIFGGEGFILQRLSGDGLAFCHAGGMLMQRRLAQGETLRVDTGCIVAFQPSVEYDIKFVGGFKNTLFGGEGLFFATLSGPGDVWLQSLPFSRLAGRIMGAAAGGKGEGSILGGLGRVLDGDNS